MAIDCYALKNIKNIIDIVLKQKKECNVLLLGYADILLTKNQLNMFLPETIVNNLIVREDSLYVAAMYNIEDLVDWCCETYSLFESLKCCLTVIDFTAWTGKEDSVDLNYPVNDKYKNQFDLIIDSGTTEHIFNISQAMFNILDMLKVGGYVSHITPFNDPNHGFYSFSPTFYLDFYEANNAEIVHCRLTQSDCKAEEIELPQREVFHLDGGMNNIVARKKSILDIMLIPIQGRYKNSSLEDSSKILKKYDKYENIILTPHNGQAKFLKKIFVDKNISILDDNEILVKYSYIEPICNITKKEFDIVLITSITFETKIRRKLENLGVPQEKIVLQY